MTKKTFPLPLSSVLGKGKRTSSASPEASLPNAPSHSVPVANNVARPTKSYTQVRVTSSMRDLSETGLVSASVRRAMARRVAEQGVKDEVVLEAIATAPRHLFLDAALASQAYIDASLPIGYQQTISQPYIVARMIEVMRDFGEHALNKVLEIGTGCGYQALVLSHIAKEVYSIERIKGLHELAKQNLRPLRVPNIRLHYGDGMLGLPNEAPFDGIILAAAGLDVPQALLAQLAIGGRLVAPVGGDEQSLELIVRTGQQTWERTVLESCYFVPLCEGKV